METGQWESLQRAIESDIDPLLKQFGYSSKGAEGTEGGGIYIQYEPDESTRPSIGIDAIKQPEVDHAKRLRYVSFLRVYIGSSLLKSMQDTTLETNPFLKLGWIHADDPEMFVSIQQIVEGLNRFLNAPSDT